MPGAYVATGRGAVASVRTIATMIAATTKRGILDEFVVSVSGAPADNTIIWTLQRCTTAGTVTAVVAVAKDPGDPAALVTSGENASAEPTYTAATEFFDQGVNQRAVYRQVYSPGRELVLPATASNGLGMKAAHASATPNSEVMLSWLE